MDDLFIKLSMTSVFGRLAGDPAGPLLLGIHGWSQRNGWHTWEPLLPDLARAGCCAVALDMPGWGQSPALDALPLTGERAAQVIIDIMDVLQKPMAVLLGKSWGGGVALQAALDFPQRIAALILTAPAAGPPIQKRLAEVEQPALIAWAKDDSVIPLATARASIDQMPNAQWVIYDSGGHNAAPANAPDFAPRAVTFLRRIGLVDVHSTDNSGTQL